MNQGLIRTFYYDGDTERLVVELSLPGDSDIGRRSLRGINTPEGLRTLAATLTALADERQRQIS
jgi:uncharacterized protein YjiK